MDGDVAWWWLAGGCFERGGTKIVDCGRPGSVDAREWRGKKNRKCGREGVDGLGYGLVDMWAPCRLVGMSEHERMENESERRRTKNDGVRSLQPRIHDLRFL